MLTLDPAVKGALPRGPQSRPHDVELGIFEQEDGGEHEIWILGPVTSADIDIIARGRAAGRQGLCPSLCPEVPGTREADLWHFGHGASP